LLFEMYLVQLAPPQTIYSVDRYTYFKTQVLEIIAHNNNPQSTWRREINEFTGMTLQELEGVVIMAPQFCSATNGVSALGLTNLPESFDWRDKKVVSKVKRQVCGDCWAHSTTAAIESHWALVKKTELPDVSRQQLVDCAGDFENHGCQGGLPSHAFEYIKYAGGIEDELDYPYRGFNGQCKFEKAKVHVTVPFGSYNITEGDEKGLQESLFTAGPISVAFEVASDFFQYRSGIYESTKCRNTTDKVNHAVLAVGFGHDAAKNVDYWIVKNSWGTIWGEEGYFRIKRGVNMCGIAVCASYPQIQASLETITN